MVSAVVGNVVLVLWVRGNVSGNLCRLSERSSLTFEPGLRPRLFPLRWLSLCAHAPGTALARPTGERSALVLPAPPPRKVAEAAAVVAAAALLPARRLLPAGTTWAWCTGEEGGR